MFKDLLSDALTCIRNGVRAKKTNVKIRTNNVIIGVLRVLQEGGFIKSYDICDDKKERKIANVELKYNSGSVIREIKKISKQSRRVYSKNSSIPRVYNNLGTVIVSTSEGIMTGNEAKRKKLGGELLCSVF